MKTDGAYLTHAKNTIAWSLYESGAEVDEPLIVYLHGFKGFKDWGFVPEIGHFLNVHGFKVLAFNFSHNGIGEQTDNFTELDKFRDNTFSLELSEALEIVQACHKGLLHPGLKPSKIGLLGHSRGGGIALLAAAASPFVDAVCTWAAVSHFDRYPPEMIDQWQRDGVLEVKNARTGQLMHLGWNLHADLIAHMDQKLNIRKAVESLKVPLCIIHGSEDEAVPLQDAREIHEWAGSYKSNLHEIGGANHTFGARHPWAGMPEALDHVLDLTARFFMETFVN